MSVRCLGCKLRARSWRRAEARKICLECDDRDRVADDVLEPPVTFSEESFDPLDLLGLSSAISSQFTLKMCSEAENIKQITSISP